MARTGNRHDQRAIVVGGGLGGVAAAVALRAVGHDVLVLERRSTPPESNSGILLWPNGVRALDALGIGEKIRRYAIADRPMGICDRRGDWLAPGDSGQFARHFQAPAVLVPRMQLHGLLSAELPPEAVGCGYELQGFTQHPDGVEVRYLGPSGARKEFTTLMVAADGGFSVVRRSLFPQARHQYAGFTVWRGTVPGPVDLGVQKWGETWADGKIFGLLALADDSVYWFAAAPTAAGRAYPDEAAEVTARFAGWPEHILRAVSLTPHERLMRHDAYQLRPGPDRYVSGSVALLGDAAHLMTPNLAQGACQAFEDAVELAAAVSGGGDMRTSLARYDQQRRPRATEVAERSWRSARFSMVRSPVIMAARNRIMRRAAASGAPSDLAPVLNWDPPILAPTAVGPEPRQAP